MVSAEKKLVFSHVERTGGTSIDSWFKKVFTPERVLFYSSISDSLTRGSDIFFTHPQVDKIRTMLSMTPLMSIVAKFYFVRLRLAHTSHIQVNNLLDNFDIITGHFTANKFDDVLPNANKAVVLRNPLERAVSHWVYYESLKGNVDHRVMPHQRYKTFEEMAFDPLFQNYQTQALGTYQLSDFDIVGVTSHLDRFSSDVLKLMNLNNSAVIPILHVSPHPEKKALDFSEAFQRRFVEFHSQDYINYMKALAMVGNKN